MTESQVQEPLAIAPRTAGAVASAKEFDAAPKNLQWPRSRSMARVTEVKG